MVSVRTPKKPGGGKRVSSNGWPVISLFSGAGGLDQGFKKAGFHPVLAIDINQAAVETYKRNHPDTQVILMDLAEADPMTILDLWEDSALGLEPVGIIGGPPCQGFSASNVHQTEKDPRRELLHNYASIINAFATRHDIDFFVLENVPGLIGNKHKAFFEEFKNMVGGGGTGTVEFEVAGEVLDAGTFGVPQRRKRLIAVGVNKTRRPGVQVRLQGGACQVPPSIKKILKGLPEPTFCAKGLTPDDIPHHPNHVAMVPKSPRFTDGSLLAGNSKGLSFKVLSWDAPSYTVAYGHNEVHVHPDCHRRLSIYEAMLLQGFTHSYQLVGTFTEQVRLISDAVPPPLAEGIANDVAESLGYEATHLHGPSTREVSSSHAQLTGHGRDIGSTESRDS